MNYKLKHLAKYCCKPADEFEFNLVKEQAELGGIKIAPDLSFEELEEYPYLTVNYIEGGNNRLMSYHIEEDLISCLDFIKKLRMSEEEARALEDDRVKFGLSREQKWMWSDDDKSLIALNGHYFKTNEDGTEVTLHKR